MLPPPSVKSLAGACRRWRQMEVSWSARFWGLTLDLATRAWRHRWYLTCCAGGGVLAILLRDRPWVIVGILGVYLVIFVIVPGLKILTRRLRGIGGVGGG